MTRIKYHQKSLKRRGIFGIARKDTQPMLQRCIFQEILVCRENKYSIRENIATFREKGQNYLCACGSQGERHMNCTTVVITKGCTYQKMTNIHDDSRVTAQETRKQLKNFLALASGAVPSRAAKSQNWTSLTFQELTESPVYIIKNVPVSKTSVLDYFGLLLIDHMNCHLRQLENPTALVEFGSTEEAAVYLAETVQSLVRTRSNTWTLLTFQWSIETLADMSRRFSTRRPLSSGSLADSLKVYAGNKATKSVLDLLARCVGELLNFSPEKCVSTLLDTSAKYGVYFDWILTYISTIYPKVIIGHLLNCGLSDFSTYVVDMSSKLSSMPINQIIQRCEQYNRDKLASLASILSQLAAQQSHELSSCFKKLFEEAIQVDTTPRQQCGLTFLLKLAVFSREIAEILIKDLGSYATAPILIKITELVNRIPAQVLFPDQSILNAIVSIFSSLNHSKKCTDFALDKLYQLAFDDSCLSQSVGEWSIKLQKGSQAVLEILLNNMEKQIHAQYNMPLDRLPILQRIVDDLTTSVCRMLNCQANQSKYYFKMVALTCLVKNIDTSAFVLALILLKSENDKQLIAFVDLASIVAPFQPTIFEHLIVKLRHHLAEAQLGLKKNFPPFDLVGSKKNFSWASNFLRLLRFEQNLDGNRDGFWIDLSKAIANNYSSFFDQLISFCFIENYDFEENNAVDSTGRLALEILNSLSPPVSLLITEAYKIVSFCVRLILSNLSQISGDRVSHTFHLSMDYALTFVLSQTSLASEAFLKLLFHNLLSEDQWIWILAPGDPSKNFNPENFENPWAGDGLLVENRKLNASQLAPASLIHSGVIKDRRIKGRLGTEGQSYSSTKKLALLKLISRLCLSNKSMTARHSSPASLPSSNYCNLEVCRQISLRLNEYICPDCIASEHSWDDWDYVKNNIERLLIVSKQTNDVPFIWETLFIIAEGYPSLWYSLPIMKSVLATLMIKFETSADKTAKSSPQLLSILKKWFAVACKGKIIVPPMAYLYDVIELVTNYESFVILLQIWRYFQVVWPDLIALNQHFDCFQLKFENQLEFIKRDPTPFLEPVRLVMQANIRTTGCMFQKIFKTQ